MLAWPQVVVVEIDGNNRLKMGSEGGDCQGPGAVAGVIEKGPTCSDKAQTKLKGAWGKIICMILNVLSIRYL